MALLVAKWLFIAWRILTAFGRYDEVTALTLLMLARVVYQLD